MAFSDVIQKWKDPNPFYEVTTSGSTGHPKVIRISKLHMAESARMSLKYFGLRKGTKVLLVLPTNKIGGVMLCVRAIVGKLIVKELTPRLNPLLDSEVGEVDFCSLTPAQLRAILKEPRSKIKLRKIKKILLGGSAVQEETLNEIQKLESEFFHSYGMTETISHIAVKNLTKREKSFRALDGVTFSCDQDQRLRISAPKILQEDLLTNDLVELLGSKEMIWLGRFDNVVNSGGVKLILEDIEARIRASYRGDFYLSKEEDEDFGERIVMIAKEEVGEEAFSKLGKFERPRNMYVVDKFTYTENGKLLRLTPQQLKDL